MKTKFRNALGIILLMISGFSCDSGTKKNNYRQPNSSSYYNNNTNSSTSNYNYNSQNQIKLEELLQQSKTSGYYTVATNLNVRTTPSTKGNILGQFSFGQKIYVSGFSGKWAIVNVQLENLTSRTAYIHSKYINKVSNYNQYNYSSGYKSRRNYKTYDYDVSGYGDDGYVYGDITVDKNGGDGYIYDDDGNEKWIDVEWTGNGTLEGYDEDGNYYELDVD